MVRRRLRDSLDAATRRAQEAGEAAKAAARETAEKIGEATAGFC